MCAPEYSEWAYELIDSLNAMGLIKNREIGTDGGREREREQTTNSEECKAERDTTNTQPTQSAWQVNFVL